MQSYDVQAVSSAPPSDVWSALLDMASGLAAYAQQQVPDKTP
jgi:hypothetical protein